MKVASVACLIAALHCFLAINLEGEPNSITEKRFEFEDQFNDDSLADYSIRGEVQWNRDRLTLAEKSVTAKKFLSGPRFSVEIELQPSVDSSGISVTRLKFPMTLGFGVVIRIARVKTGDTYQAQLEIANVRRSGDGDPEITLLRRIPLEVSLDRSERWKFKFDYGVIHTSIDGRSYRTAYVGSDGAWCRGMVVSSDKGSTDLVRLSVAGSDPTMSPAEAAVYRQIKRNNSQASDMPTEELTEWLKLKHANIELMRDMHGEGFYAIGIEHQAIGHRFVLLGKHAEAAEAYESSDSIFTEAYGADHPATLMSRVETGDQYVKSGEFVRGLSLILPNLDRLLRVAGSKGQAPKNALIIATNWLGRYQAKLSEKQEYSECVKISRQLLALLKIQYGNNTVAYQSHDTRIKFLEQLYAATGKRRKALIEIDAMFQGTTERPDQENARQTLDFRLKQFSLCREHLGPRHPITLDVLMDLCVDESNVGDFGSSQRHANEACEGYKNIFGVDHPDYAASLIRLASSYSTTQRFQKATPLFNEALKILDKAGDLWDVEHALALLERGRHWLRLEQYDDAEKDLVAAYELFIEEELEASSVGAQALETLGNIYRASGDFTKTNETLDKHRNLVLKHFGRDSKEYYQIALSEAIQAQWQGKPDVAKEKYAEARKLAIRYYGRHSRVFDAVIGSELDFYLAQRDSARAGEILQELIEFQRQRRETLFDISSTSEQFSRSLIDQDLQNRVMNVATLKLLNASDAYQMVLATKGAVAEHQRRQAFARRDPELKSDVDRLQAISTQLTNRGSRMNTDKDATYVLLSDERLQIQRRIATHARKSAAEHKRTTPSTIRQSLEPGSVVVDYVEYYVPINFLVWATNRVERRMAAFVYSADRDVELIELGPSEEIEKRWLQWFKAMGDEFALLSPEDALLSQQAVDAAGIELRKLVLDPFLHGHQPPKALVVSPAGCLNLCPFAALPVRRDGRLLIEELPVSYTLAAQLMDSTGIVRSGSDDASLLLVGDIDYGRPLFGTQEMFLQLPGTMVGLDPLRASFERKYGVENVVSLIGTDANEIRFGKAVSNARFVHIHTHGFSIDSSKLTGTATNGQSNSVSGIALADANSKISTRSALGGILWDDEMATLDWTNADLVVLAACQTALGSVRPGEGMQGLHRALAVSGAASSITTLWTVRHGATIALVNRFYQGLLDENLTKTEALRHAKIKMLRSYNWRGDDESRSERCPIALWAPFVLYGDQ